MTQKVMTKEELESKENELFMLPDLYIRKLRLIERVHNLRRNFVPKENRIIPSVNVRDERGFTQWDYVLQEVKWMACDFREERKYKLALAYHCSRRIMKQTKQENIYNQELVLYHKLVSHEMAEMVRNEFQGLTKEVPKEPQPEAEKINMDIEVSSVQNDVDVLDLDLEMNKKGSGILSNNINTNTNSVPSGGLPNGVTPMIKKQPSSLQISNFSIPSNKIKKKGGTNLLKTPQLPIPVIKKQPLLLEYMKKTLDFVGSQPLDACCLIDKAQVYENLAKLFKRFPKKSKHLKSNVPDIFNTNSSFQGPNITPFDDNFKSATIPNLAVETSGQKKRKKTNLKEEFVRGNVFQASELKKGSDFLNFKKLKNPENFDEVLTLFYCENKIGDGDYQKIFPNSLEIVGQQQLPKTWDEVPTMKFHEVLLEKEFRRWERTFDEDFERNNEENLVMMESFMEGLGDKMDRYYFNRKQLINCDNSTIRRFLDRDEISASELIYSFPKLNKNFLITYSKEGHRSKFKLFKEYQGNPHDGIMLESHLSRKWPLIMHYLLDHYFNMYGNKWNLISDALNINILTRNCMLTDEVSETKWISFLSKKGTHKIIDSQTKMFPCKAKYFPPTDFQKPEKMQEEFEQNPKRKSVYKKMNSRKKNDLLDEDYEKYKETNQKFEKKDMVFPIYPCERATTVFENLKSDINKEKIKEIYELMEIPPRKQILNPDIQLNVNRFMNYENFLTENDSKLKASLVNSYSYANTKRKRYISEKIIPNLVKLIVESKHQQQMRQYSAPNPIPGGPPPNPNGYNVPMPPHYVPKMPMPHPMNPEVQQPNPLPPNPQNYPIHPPMPMPPNNMQQHIMNMRPGPPEQSFNNPPSRNFNYMTAPPNPKNPMMTNGRPPQPPPRMGSGEYMNNGNMPNNMTGGMTLRGPSMGTVNMNNGAVNMQGVNRSNVYQLNQINTVNNIKNEQLKMVKKPKN